MSEFGVQYQLRPAIKAQPLIDFIVECSYNEQVVEEGETEWKLYINGVSNRASKVLG